MKKLVLSTILLASTIIFSCCEEEEKIENWIVGTWNIDKYEQLDYEDGELTGESVSTNQGKIEFNEDGTGSDIGGNFIGSDFEWENTDEKLILTAGGTTTEYKIEEYSTTNFVFSITTTSGSAKEVQRWYLSK
ncbi:MAG: hypothetical protein KGY69_13870 [Bacteroidales bacterium]|nr:hypothetical protein [Bacteroidales bacterium]